MRRLVAALACRVESARLYAKPLQRLGEGVAILDQILDALGRIPVISERVLGISSLEGNEPFAALAGRRGAKFVYGDPEDVVGRLLQSADAAEGTDLFLVTSENPFVGHEWAEEAWRRHVANGNDVTALEGAPDGMCFEIYRMEALRLSHRRGSPAQREHVSRYIKQNLEDFQIEVVEPEPPCMRPD
ncbi:MAG: acylneuraminate cytidylyltransferase, partial [bacterium]